jgi:hypothetical protein
MACLISQAFKETQYYNQTPRNQNICRNPAIAAAATQYAGSYKLFAPCPGKYFRTNINLAKIKSAVAGITALAVDATVIGVFDELTDGNSERYSSIGDLITDTKRTYRGLNRGAFWLPNEFNSANGASSVRLGDSIGSSELSVMEDDFSDQMRGMAADGSASPSFKTIKDPATGANVYGVMARKFVTPGVMSIETKANVKIGSFGMKYEGMVAVGG